MSDVPAVRVFIATNVNLYQEGLREVLSARSGLDVVGSARNVTEIRAALSDTRPDVLLLDPAVPDAVRLAQEIFDSPLRCNVLVLGMAEGETELITWASAGIAGFVTCDDDLDDLVGTIRAVIGGRWHGSPKTTSTLFGHLARVARGSALETPGHLTDRESEVAQLLARGMSNEDIGRELGIAIATAKNHVHNILKKLNLRRRGQAAAWMRPRMRDARRSRTSSPGTWS